MCYDRIGVDLLKTNGDMIRGEFFVYEVAPENREHVFIEIHYDGKSVSKEGSDLFTTLQAIRKDLEQEGILVMCNGAARNVFPSPMQLDMGVGWKAHILELGCPTKAEDIVDIFKKKEGLVFTTVDEQIEFNRNWQNRIKARRKGYNGG